jgi:predicted PurR-regulated permease PerM
MGELGNTLQLWFLGQFADMAVVTVLTGAGLSVLGVPLSLTLALIAGLFNFVPYIGALAGAVPALAVAVGQSPQTAIYVAILFAVVQTLEGNIIGPLIQKRTVDLPPALTIMSQTVLGTLFGVMGLILATPLTAAAMTAVRMVYVETVLENHAPPV